MPRRIATASPHECVRALSRRHVLVGRNGFKAVKRAKRLPGETLDRVLPASPAPAPASLSCACLSPALLAKKLPAAGETGSDLSCLVKNTSVSLTLEVVVNKPICENVSTVEECYQLPENPP